MKRGPKDGAGHDLSMARAVAAWGEAMPDWVTMLAQMADRSSQGAVARDIGYSNSTVNEVLGGTYSGKLDGIEKAVRGRFMQETVACPVLGEIGAHICLAHQKRARVFSASSPVRVAVAKACRGPCPHSRLGRR